MRKGGGKAKGASFERDVCRQLSLWVSGGTQEDVFWRSAMSGGRSTVAHAKGKRLAAQAGDISCIHPSGENFASKFLCECKNYSSLDYPGLLTNKGHLAEFWGIVKIEASTYNKHPFMIAKQNRYPTTICLSHKGVFTIGAAAIVALLEAPRLDLFIYDAKEFFNAIPSYR